MECSLTLNKVHHGRSSVSTESLTYSGSHAPMGSLSPGSRSRSQTTNTSPSPSLIATPNKSVSDSHSSPGADSQACSTSHSSSKSEEKSPPKFAVGSITKTDGRDSTVDNGEGRSLIECDLHDDENSVKLDTKESRKDRSPSLVRMKRVYESQEEESKERNRVETTCRKMSENEDTTVAKGDVTVNGGIGSSVSPDAQSEDTRDVSGSESVGERENGKGSSERKEAEVHINIVAARYVVVCMFVKVCVWGGGECVCACMNAHNYVDLCTCMHVCVIPHKLTNATIVIFFCSQYNISEVRRC